MSLLNEVINELRALLYTDFGEELYDAGPLTEIGLKTLRHVLVYAAARLEPGEWTAVLAHCLGTRLCVRLDGHDWQGVLVPQGRGLQTAVGITFWAVDEGVIADRFDTLISDTGSLVGHGFSACRRCEDWQMPRAGELVPAGCVGCAKTAFEFACGDCCNRWEELHLYDDRGMPRCPTCKGDDVTAPTSVSTRTKMQLAQPPHTEQVAPVDVWARSDELDALTIAQNRRRWGQARRAFRRPPGPFLPAAPLERVDLETARAMADNTYRMELPLDVSGPTKQINLPPPTDDEEKT